MPEKKDDKETKNKNGKVIRVRSTAKSNLSIFWKKPGAIKYTKNGVKISANKTKKSKAKEINVNTSLAKLIPLVLLSEFSLVKLGINAELNVPSAKSRLNVLGNLKATKKASAYMVAPKKIAIRISLK